MWQLEPGTVTILHGPSPSVGLLALELALARVRGGEHLGIGVGEPVRAIFVSGTATLEGINTTIAALTRPKLTGDQREQAAAVEALGRLWIVGVKVGASPPMVYLDDEWRARTLATYCDKMADRRHLPKLWVIGPTSGRDETFRAVSWANMMARMTGAAVVVHSDDVDQLPETEGCYIMDLEPLAPSGKVMEFWLRRRPLATSATWWDRRKLTMTVDKDPELSIAFAGEGPYNSVPVEHAPSPPAEPQGAPAPLPAAPAQPAQPAPPAPPAPAPPPAAADKPPTTAPKQPGVPMVSDEELRAAIMGLIRDRGEGTRNSLYQLLKKVDCPAGHPRIERALGNLTNEGYLTTVMVKLGGQRVPSFRLAEGVA